MMRKRQAWSRLGIVILIYTGLAVAHSLWLPLHKAPDEIAHFQYSRFIAANGRLPIDYTEREMAGFKSDWPPLYHILVAILTGWSDSDGPPYLKFVDESPRFDLARELLDTKRLANSEDEAFPYQGAVLMWHLGRLMSIGLGIGVIIITFLTTLEFFPRRYALAIFAAASVAFIPTFIFISSAMSDDPLVALIMGLYMLVTIKIVKGEERSTAFLLLGILMGLSVATKYSTAILPLQAIILLTFLAWRQQWGWGAWFKRLAYVGGSAILAASWWFGWVIFYFQEVAEYGLLLGAVKPLLAGGIDPSQKYVAFKLTGGQIGTTESPDIVPEPFWLWVSQMFQSFWVTKIGDYPLGPGLHLFVGLICVVVFIGLIKLWQQQPQLRIWLGVFALQVLLFLLFPLLRFSILGHVDQTAQGRHLLFPIITILPIIFIYGWQGWLSLRLQPYVALIFVAGLLCWSLAQAVRVATFYTPPLPVQSNPEILAQITHPLYQKFGEHLELIGYDTHLLPQENSLKLSLYWRSPTYADEDYVLDIQVLQAGQPKLQWSTYPVNGRYPTRIWESWETIRDDIYFPLVDLPAGRYDIQLRLQGRDGPLLREDKSDHLLLTDVAIPAFTEQPSEIDLSLTVEGQSLVEGVSLGQAEQYRELGLPKYRPRMTIPLIWTGNLTPGQRVEWLLVSPLGEVYPAQRASPHFSYFLVGLAWPSGEYRLRAEVWQDESVLASQETAPAAEIFNERPRNLQLPVMVATIEADFAQQIKLLGYDVPRRIAATELGIPLTLYWQGLRTMGTSYTVFTKLLDQEQQQWTSVERLPADGYATIYWLEDEVVSDSFELPLPTTPLPPGLYWLNIGLYEEIDQIAVSLPLVQEGQVSEVTSVTIGPIKVGGPPPGVVLSPSDINPTQPLSIAFGDPAIVRLHGVDLTESGEVINLRFYWESLAPTSTDWTVFVHIRNQAGEVVAQKDGPAGNGRYPTSLWDRGEIIKDQLIVPANDLQPGIYDVVIGLYDFSTGVRLSIPEQEDNALLLSSFEVAP